MPLVRKSPPSSQPQAATLADVLRRLASDDAEERWAAARVAVEVAGGASALASALPSEPDARVRESMFTSLTRIGSAESVAAISPLLRSDDASLRTGALDALRAMSDAVRKHLPALLDDRDSDVRLLSCEIARSLPSEAATELLCDLLAREQEVNVCAAAIEVLAEVGTPKALATLKHCATKFAGTPFLEFAIRTATERIQSPFDGRPAER